MGGMGAVAISVTTLVTLGFYFFIAVCLFRLMKASERTSASLEQIASALQSKKPFTNEADS